ncbi:unnamed protein product [Bemisia tabaci]|uniref:Uncharacterized protein n=1 Tax=Bemisia tabaci TaxID=7038 RepID=A0A9P0AJA0_BEMTA|nr:unnamed protein product [Bemisia tabaci]
MPGTPPSSDLNENIRRVLLVIDRNMNPSQQSSVDPCRQYQLVKERQLEANPPQTSRNTRRSRSNNPDPLTPNAEAAMSGCSTAVNAFLALPPAYRTACPKVQNAACKNIDSYLTCAVLIPTYALGCIYTGLTYLSLKRCADHAIQERDRAIREQREAEMIRVHQRQLSERARAVAAANAAAYPPAPVASAPAGPRTSGQGGGRRASPPSTPAVLKNERDKTKLKFIKDNDYILYSDYAKLYLNKNSKKTSSNSNSKNKKIDLTKECDKKSNTDKEEKSNSTLGKNKKEILEPTNNTGNKRDFSILESHSEMETEENEPKVDLEPKEIVGNKNSARKPPPIFIINEEPDAIKDTLKDYRIDYTLKNESNQKFKLMIKSEEDYKVTLQKLVDLGVKFYTFQFLAEKLSSG